MTCIDDYVNRIIQGDCLEVLKGMPDNSVDTVIQDPPSGINFMGKKWDSDKGGIWQWIDWMADIQSECLRVLKPGGSNFCWALPRTSHWTGTALELAGFEIRDIITHLFGQGFPKNYNIQKGIDKLTNGTEDAETWEGYGTALKPAAEFWYWCMKPIDESFANNALTWGVAGLWIDGARVSTGDDLTRPGANPLKSMHRTVFEQGARPKDYYKDDDTRKDWGSTNGRWPANVILDEEAARLLDEQSGVLKSGENTPKNLDGYRGQRYCGGWKSSNVNYFPANSGGASRFFYCAKASKRERGDYNNHPTVKPLAIVEYLCKLSRTPTGGIVLDPFSGSGTLALAALKTGRQYICIEQDAHYVEIAERRVSEFDGVQLELSPNV